MGTDSIMFYQNNTYFVRSIDYDGQVIYRAYWYQNGCCVCTDWRSTISEVIDSICDCYEEYGQTQGNYIKETMWADLDNAPAISKGRRVDQALYDFIEHEQEKDSSVQKYTSLAEYEIANECY